MHESLEHLVCQKGSDQRMMRHQNDTELVPTGQIRTTVFYYSNGLSLSSNSLEPQQEESHMQGVSSQKVSL